MAAVPPLLPRSLAPTIQEALADTPVVACSVRGRRDERLLAVPLARLWET